MKTTMLSKLLYGAGVIAIVTAIIQWYVKFPDVSQLVFGLHIAVTMVMAAYLHSVIRNIGKELKGKEEQIEELNKALDVAINYSREVEDLKKRKE